MRVSESQVPGTGEIFLDHVGWFIRDVDEATRAFERLGFVLTPFVVSRNADPAGGPPKPSGTGNRCAMLRLGYLELIAGIAGVDTPLARQHREALDRYVGLHVVAFTVADAHAHYRHLQGEGFEPGEPVKLRRPITAPDGSDRFAEFTVVRVPPEKMPEGRIQLLTQETPDLIWQPQLIARDNGVVSLTSAYVCTANVEEATARYARFLKREPAEADNEGSVFELDRGTLYLVSPGRAREYLDCDVTAVPSIVAIGLGTTDLKATRRFLDARGIPILLDSRDSFRVAPNDALGATLVIHRV